MLHTALETVDEYLHSRQNSAILRSYLTKYNRILKAQHGARLGQLLTTSSRAETLSAQHTHNSCPKRWGQSNAQTTQTIHTTPLPATLSSTTLPSSAGNVLRCGRMTHAQTALFPSSSAPRTGSTHVPSLFNDALNAKRRMNNEMRQIWKQTLSGRDLIEILSCSLPRCPEDTYEHIEVAGVPAVTRT
jgi:hypothetical protein